MTPALGSLVYLVLVVGWFIIRLPHELRSRRTPVACSQRGAREVMLLSISLLGLGILPLVYVATGFPQFADYTFHPDKAIVGCLLVGGSLWMFYRTHKALGRNWSVTLEVREHHVLITDGIYRRVRHPMYTAFWLWAVAQALLLPNFVAAISGLVGFGTLYAFRVRKEERLMSETFGEAYRSYMARTKRLIPWLY